MKEKLDNTSSTVQQPLRQPSHPASDYFTKEVNDAMMSMPQEEMFRELVALEGSRLWIAILKYTQIRLHISQGAIMSADPHKDPTLIARHQGIMLGLSDLQNAVIMLKAEQDEKIAEDEANASGKEQ